MRATVGIASFRICSFLVTMSGPRMVFPVMLPAGCARLVTNPDPIGSLIDIATIGIVFVARCCSFGTRCAECHDYVHRKLRKRHCSSIQLVWTAIGAQIHVG